MRKEPNYGWGLATSIGDELKRGALREIQAKIARGEPLGPVRLITTFRPEGVGSVDPQEAQQQGV